jgi:uncharacterized protein
LNTSENGCGSTMATFWDLDWHGAPSAYQPLVLLLHGLTGSSGSHYIVGQQCALAAQGWASVALNWRGCSGEPNLLARSYHSGASEDLAAAVAHLRARFPLAPLYAVGYSLGGNVLLKYLGESGQRQWSAGRSRVSVPFRLDQCADRIGLGFSKVYQAHFMREMVAYVKNKQRQFTHGRQAGRPGHGWPNWARLIPEQMRTFWEFDDRVTAPLNGYLNVDDYYRRASSRYFLGAIETPTLIIQSEDDPFRVQAQHPRSQRAVTLHRAGAARQGRPCGLRGRFLENTALLP